MRFWISRLSGASEDAATRTTTFRCFLPLFVCPKLSSPVNFDITESIIALEWEQVKTSHRFPIIFKLPFSQSSTQGSTLNFCVFSGVLTNLILTVSVHSFHIVSFSLGGEVLALPTVPCQWCHSWNNF